MKPLDQQRAAETMDQAGVGLFLALIVAPLAIGVALGVAVTLAMLTLIG